MTTPPTTRSRDILWVTGLLAASTWQLFRSMGHSPTVWVDTLFENVFIRDCLEDQRCSLVGAGATAGIFHSAGYLHWRIFLESIGVGANGTHAALLCMAAVGVTLAALAARRLDGGLAAALAALLVLSWIGIPTQLNVISDVAPLPFMGSVFLLVALSVHHCPSLWGTALLGVVGGVMANVYATGLLCVVSSVWLALLTPNRRRAHVAVAIVTFGVTTFLIAPGTWITDARLILSQGIVGNAAGSARRALFSIPLARATAAATLLWILAALFRPSLRRLLDVPAAIVVPLFVPLALGTWAGKLDPQDKYCSHVLSSVAVVLAVSALHLLRSLRLPIGLLDRLAPYAATAFIAFSAFRQEAPDGAEAMSFVTFDDLAATQRALNKGHGWSVARTRQGLRTTDEVVKRALLEWPDNWEETPEADPSEHAFLLRVSRDRIPPTLPANAETLAAQPAGATLLVFACSWLDWSTFRACVQAEGEASDRCTDGGIPAEQDIHADYGVPGLPTADEVRRSRLRLSLRFPLTPREACPEFAVQLPSVAGVCPGRIVGATGAAIALQDDGRRALLRVDGKQPSERPELAIEWDLGNPHCQLAYRGEPPFFLEGDTASVHLMAAMLPGGR